MNLLRTRSRAGALLLLFAAGTASADAVDDYVQSVMTAEKIPGVSLVIQRDGKAVKSRGYGFANVELQVPATADTIYQSGSVGKQFTAAGILLLAEDGKLSLDDRLAKFYPDGPPHWHRITIRQLLTHTSGIKDYSDEYDMRADYTEKRQVEIAKTIPLDFEPGTQWSYSNTGYLILGALVSKLAGKHWSEFLAERVFTPLGMKTARMISERDLVMHRADGYELDDKGEVKNQGWVSPDVNTTGDGALYFSAKDLAAWNDALDAGKFLSPDHFKAWWTPVALANGTTYPYGFGWGIGETRGYLEIEHGGAWQGFRTAIERFPEQHLNISVLTNLDAADPGTMAKVIAGLVEPALRLPDPDARPADPDPALTKRLREVLAAWADYRVTPDMARGLAATAAGSGREAYARQGTGEKLSAAEEFAYVGEDDLSRRDVEMYGEKVARSVYCALRTKESRFLYKFRLNGSGQVLDFESTEL
jgi:CubicO group peptidase (beta-lactamase class C family)